MTPIQELTDYMMNGPLWHSLLVIVIIIGLIIALHATSKRTEKARHD